MWGSLRRDPPLLGEIFGGETKTITRPIVVKGTGLGRLAAARWTESVLVRRRGSSLEGFLTGEKVFLVAVGEAEADVDLTNLGQR